MLRTTDEVLEKRELYEIRSDVKDIKHKLEGPDIIDVVADDISDKLFYWHEKKTKEIEDIKSKHRKMQNRPKWIGTVQDLIGSVMLLVGFFLFFMSGDVYLISIGIMLAVAGVYVIWI